ncbi:hypothetical protein BSY17_4212 (plasmid) [Sphingobium sp. RAC03]|nr:hypothetical protein BSY17_4212 [Sphingobium sp. RAC03]
MGAAQHALGDPMFLVAPCVASGLVHHQGENLASREGKRSTASIADLDQFARLHDRVGTPLLLDPRNFHRAPRLIVGCLAHGSTIVRCDNTVKYHEMSAASSSLHAPHFSRYPTPFLTIPHPISHDTPPQNS